VPRALATLVCGLWCACVGYGFTQLARHELSPGASAARAASSAALEAIDWSAAAQRPELVVFAHPHCPCTRASLNELAQIAARCGERLAIRVYVEDLGDPARRAEQSASWTLASSIPGARVELDRESRVARAFEARTSGQAFLIDARGEIAFTGGLTRARGHEGESAGSRAVLELALGRASEVLGTPVYGCALACAANPESPAGAESALP